MGTASIDSARKPTYRVGSYHLASISHWFHLFGEAVWSWRVRSSVVCFSSSFVIFFLSLCSFSFVIAFFVVVVVLFLLYNVLRFQHSYLPAPFLWACVEHVSYFPFEFDCAIAKGSKYSICYVSIAFKMLYVYVKASVWSLVKLLLSDSSSLFYCRFCSFVNVHFHFCFSLFFLCCQRESFCWLLVCLCFALLSSVYSFSIIVWRFVVIWSIVLCGAIVVLCYRWCYYRMSIRVLLACWLRLVVVVVVVVFFFILPTVSFDVFGETGQWK